MKPYRHIFLFAALFILLSTSSCISRKGYTTISGYAQGGTYSVTFNVDGVKEDTRVIRDSIDALLVKIDKSVSGYNKGSILSKFNAGERVVPDEIFLDLYSRSREIFERTGGCVDVAGAPLYDLWGFGFSADSLPSDEKVQSVLNHCGMGLLVPDLRMVLAEDSSLVAQDAVLPSLKDVVVKLNFNAVAQGYSSDLVASYLRSIGVKDMLVDIGEIYCCGRNPKGMPWRIGIDAPKDGNDTPGADIQCIFAIPKDSCGVVTSGNYRKFYIKDGRKYAHTIDPHTGFPVSHNLLSATVLASDAFTADAYASYCMVLGLDKAKEFISSDPSLEGCLIYDEDGELKTWCSAGFTLAD